MKNTLKSLMSVAAAALALTSCLTDATDEVIAKGEPKTLKVNATIEQTRTTLAENHIDLQWSDGAVGAETAEGDKIYLYIGENATEKQVINPATGGTITAVYEDGNNVYANYSIGNSFSKGVTEAEIQIVASQEQTQAGVFAGYNLPMYAKGTIKDGAVELNFKPVGCVLVFNVYGSAATDEKIQSISFETSGVGCFGYKLCNLTKEPLNYEVPTNKNLVKVTLPNDKLAPIGTAKPGNTQTADNQIYLVVAPANYPVGSKFIVTTNAAQNNTYTFTTKTALDCTTTTARVVNLNLANAEEMQPSIEVPSVNEQPSTEVSELVISDIVFKNIETVTNVSVKVYGDELLQTELNPSWITINNTASIFNDGVMKCHIDANETTDSRTAYIVIDCDGVKSPAIVVTQVAKDAEPAKYVKVTEAPANGDWSGEYLIVYEKSATEAYVWNLTDAVGCFESVQYSDNSILSNATIDKCKVVISKRDAGYLLCANANAGTNAGKYIYRNTEKNGLNFGTQSDAEAYLNTITFETSSTSETYISIVSSKIAIQFFAASGSERFRYYKSDQKKVQLYKLQ